MPPPALSHPDCDQTYLHHRAARVGGGEGGRERQREGEGGRREDGREGEGRREGGRGREDKDAVFLWLPVPLSK